MSQEVNSNSSNKEEEALLSISSREGVDKRSRSSLDESGGTVIVKLFNSTTLRDHA